MKQKNQEIRTERGQNTAEYLILLTLVVIGSISLLTVFGGEIRAKVAVAGAAIAGKQDSYEAAKEMTKVTSYEANVRARQSAVKVEGIEVEELQYGLGQ